MRSAAIFGQETEYAIRFEPEPGSPAPDNKEVYLQFKTAISEITSICDSRYQFVKKSFFCSNGGSFCYEFTSADELHGLIEGATPECGSARELVIYQRAQEKLLKDSIPRITELLEANGYYGQLSFIKNERDSLGNIYGTQENYSTTVGGKAAHILLNCAFLISIPLVGIPTLVFIIVMVVILLLVLLLQGLLALLCHIILELSSERIKTQLPSLSKFLSFQKRLFSEDDESMDLFITRSVPIKIFEYFIGLLFIPWSLTAYFCLFKKQRRALEAHLLSRIIYTGAGSVSSDGDFSLSEKATVPRKHLLIFLKDSRYPIFDHGHFCKKIIESYRILTGSLEEVKSLLPSTQRLQLSLSDSNRCETAEFLKFGITNMIVRLSEEGLLPDAPRIKRPQRALMKLNRDPSLTQTVETKNHGNMNAIEIQRWYLSKIKHHYEASSIITPETELLLETWEQTLKSLENAPQDLFGKIDWVTKKYLLARIPTDSPYEAFKKLDLKYHELGSGYYDKLEQIGEVTRLTTNNEIAKATQSPSPNKFAMLRSQFINESKLSNKAIQLNWGSAKIGNWWNPKIISFSSSPELDVIREEED